MRLCIIGAGPAGLCAARHASAAGMTCRVFEQSDAIGGTWIYTDAVGTDKHGLSIHTSMYSNLRINLPKEIVKFPDFDYANLEESYIPSHEVLNYLQRYADHFGVTKHISLNTHVKNVSYVDELWEVQIVDLLNSIEEVHIFDAIIVCSGLNETPAYPTFEGMDKFLGKTMHSHDYRKAEPFRDQNVLVVGAGPSGMDLAYQVSEVAKKVILSHHSNHIQHCDFPKSVLFKSDVKEIKENSVVFEDDCEEEIDSIIYGTGYKVLYPFLDSSCGITTDGRFVYPLYKYFINATHPTMAIIGNLSFSIQFMTFDIQIRFFLATLANDILPGKDEMLIEVDNYIEDKLGKGIKRKAIFKTTTDEDREYYKRLEEMANLKTLPNVYFNIHEKAIKTLFINFPHFRNDIYEIIDDENFIVKTIK